MAMHGSRQRQRVGTHRVLAAGLVLAALGSTWSCRSDAPRGPAQVSDEPSTEPAAAPVPTVTRPADDCGWIPAAEVEKIVGPLAGPPKATADGCVYPLVKDSATLAREERARVVQAKFDSLQKKLERAFGPSTISEEDKERLDRALPQDPAVTIDLVENVDIGTQRATGAVVERFVKEALGTRAAGEPAADSQTPPPPAEDGWDASGSGYAPFRTGHVGVLVLSEGGQVSREQKARLAALARDRIPDLPFASERGAAGAGTSGDPDPCGLLTGSEAEAVLGKLVVPPYRSQEDTPLAEPGGKSCAYFTAGHHALVLTPTWEYGGTVVEAIRGVGGLMSGVAPELRDEAADTLDGPWEEAGSDLTGGLYFLKGERVLLVHHLASSTDYDGAVRLARTAMERLAAGAAAGQRAAAERDAHRGPCPSPGGLGTAAGFDLTFTRVMGASDGWMTCMYELTGRYRGTFLTFAVQPASHANRIFAEVRRTAKALKGAGAEADRIALGDGGWAYGSGSRSQAAALVRGRLYTAEIAHIGLEGIGDQKDAMVRVLEAASR